MDALTFRTNFPEFTDTNTYPDSSINFYLNLGVKLLNPCRWGNVLDEALQLFIAHNVTLAGQSVQSASIGANPGTVVGPTASKTVDKVSISYDSEAAMEEGAGHWNLTRYGLMLKRMINMFGAGGVQVTGSCVGGAELNAYPLFPWSPY